jgi:hypothetical protein
VIPRRCGEVTQPVFGFLDQEGLLSPDSELMHARDPEMISDVLDVMVGFTPRA